MAIDAGPPQTRRSVVIAGGGVAGLAAAHRLIERGYDVTLLEANDFLGGKLGAHHDPDRAPTLACPPCAEGGVCTGGGAALGQGDWHEHCYHMYLNWYHNFWDIMAEAKALGHFVPMPYTHNIHRDQPGGIVTVANVGSLWTGARNIFSGLGSPADLWLWGQAMGDLVGTAPRKEDWLEKTSIMSYMTSRPYITEQALAGTYRTTAQAFAAPSYLSSSRSYRALLSYGARLPEPSMWLLTADTETAIFTPWLARLAEIASRFEWAAGFETFDNAEPFRKAQAAGVAARHGATDSHGALSIRVLTGVVELKLDAQSGRVTHLVTAPFQRTDRLGGCKRVPDAPTSLLAVDGDVILAVPVTTLADLVTPQVASHAPSLPNVRYLRCEPMISLDLYFNRKLAGVPRGITVLLDSPYELSFLDKAQTWEGCGEHTALNVIASKADTLVEYDEAAVLDIMLDELGRYLAFDKEADLYQCRTHLQTNVGEALFVNEVGSWALRPTAASGIANLFIAGDYCQTPVDVVTVEGAAVSGLMAAEALRRGRGHGRPITIRQPDAYPKVAVNAFATSLLPLSYLATAVSGVDEALRRGYASLFPTP